MSEDLSTIHKPIGNLFEPIKEKSEWNKFKLSEKDIEEFWRNGYLLNIPVLTEKQCDQILDDYHSFLTNKEPPKKDLLYEFHSNQSGDPDNVLMHCLGHWRVTENFHDIVFMPSVVVPTSQLLEQGHSVPVRFWHDQLFAKPPKIGGGVAWHQDYSYWTRTKPMKHLTVHIALDDQSEENGALHYIPGSHHWTRDGGKPLPVTDFNFKDMESIQTILTEEEKAAFKPVCGHLRKGEASFHHPLAVHGSYGNRSERPRRAAVLNYFADGVVSDTEEELLKGSRIPKGKKMEGNLYPIVFDPKWTE